MDIETPYINDEQLKASLWSEMNGRLKYSLMNDFLSKYSLQHDLYALKGLLAALLNIELEKIISIQILNPIEPSELLSEKDCVLDIKLELNNDTVINIEIQTKYQDFWPERSITYLCRNFDHLEAGQSYAMVKPCIQIGILSEGIFKNDSGRYTGKFVSEYRLLDTVDHTDYSSKFRIIVVSLNQLDMASDEDKKMPNGLYNWARLFRAKSWEELKMLAENNPRIESFVGTVKKLSAEEKVAQACERRRKYLNDIATYESEIQEKKLLVEEQERVIEEKKLLVEEQERVIEEKNNVIEEKNNVIEEKNNVIEEKNSVIEEKNIVIEEKDEYIKQLLREVEELKQQNKR